MLAVAGGELVSGGQGGKLEGGALKQLGVVVFDRQRLRQAGMRVGAAQPGLAIRMDSTLQIYRCPDDQIMTVYVSNCQALLYKDWRSGTYHRPCTPEKP